MPRVSPRKRSTSAKALRSVPQKSVSKLIPRSRRTFALDTSNSRSDTITDRQRVRRGENAAALTAGYVSLACLAMASVAQVDGAAQLRKAEVLSEPLPRIHHRADIDGLRAVAVVPIVLFHAGVTVLIGGFVGVDIFFVISGYLITGIIVRELDEERFSLLRFYNRRIRRIVPALVVMVLCTLAVGCFLLLPSELDRLSASSAAASAFVSNIYFWATTNYFGGEADTVPLLHTWSLGVEEQFYIFFPLGLIIVKKIAPRMRAPAILVVLLLSFAADLRWSLLASVTGFYMFPGRIWELLIGALVALHRPYPLLRWLQEALAICGAGMILIGIIVIRPEYFFPAPMALLPCGGTALLLMCGERTGVGQFLSIAALRWIGLISYSVYLWHWPIMAFMRLEWGVTLSLPLMVLAIVASVALGAASFYLVEQRFRRPKGRPNPLRTVIVGCAALAATVAVSFAVPPVTQAIAPLDARVARVSSFVYYQTDAYVRQYRPHACFAMFADQFYNPNLCLRIVPGKRNILLIGDSHGAQYWQALTRRFPEANVLQATSSGCLPQFNPKGAPWCLPIIRRALALAESDRRVDAVVFAARWMPEQVPDLTRSVHRLVNEGIPVTVIGPINEYEGDYPEVLARAMLRHDLARVQSLRSSLPQELDQRMRPAIQSAGGSYYSVIQQECPKAACRLVASDGSPFHTDYGHVDEAAAEQLMMNLPQPWRAPRGR
jgi:peptidoglycan/LPS O-acetylase OafA/YrhL